MFTRSVTVAFVLLLSFVPAQAHDFWLAAKQSADNASTTISGHVGETFPVPDTRTTPDRVASWRVIGPNGDVTSAAGFFQDGESLATRVTVTSPATYLGVMTIQPRETEMTGQEFTDYLREEGLDQVIAERARLDQTDRSARERYARYAKIVWRTGAGAAPHVTRPSGVAAEFVPSVDPAALAPG